VKEALLAVVPSHDGVLATFDRGILDIISPGAAPEEAVEGQPGPPADRADWGAV
jgi:hypothetical protein